MKLDRIRDSGIPSPALFQNDSDRRLRFPVQRCARIRWNVDDSRSRKISSLEKPTPSEWSKPHGRNQYPQQRLPAEVSPPRFPLPGAMNRSDSRCSLHEKSVPCRETSLDDVRPSPFHFQI